MSGSPPLPSSHQRRFNPFSDSSRNNFPSIDHFFRTEQNEEDCNKSAFSQGSFHGSSFLNLSIGAFAALGEHMRHVAKHGIDGEGDNDAVQVDEDNDVQLRSAELRNALDDKWDYLLEHSNVNVDGSFAALNDNAGIDNSFVGTEITNDYFNTSRVKELATPERNLDLSGIVMARGEEYIYEEEEISFDYPSSPCHLAAPEVSQNQKGQQDYYDEDEFPVNCSFASLNNVDISRISNGQEELFVQDPEESFNFLNIASPGCKLQDSSFPSTPRRPGSRTHNSSFSSTPRRQPPSSQEKTPKLRSFFSSINRRSLPLHRRPLSVLANETNRSWEYGHGKSKKTSSLMGLKNYSRDILQRAGDNRTARKQVILSPISHAKTMAPSPNDSARNCTSNEPPLSGRRKYRTVVPRRVFLESPSDFPEEQDSFSVIAQDDDDGDESFTNPITDESPARSLMDSFDAVSQNYIFQNMR